MADPITMMAVGSMAATAAGAGVKAFGDVQAAGAKSAAYTYQAGIAKMNADIAEGNAERATKVGEVKAQQAGMETRADIGQTKAVQSGRNLNVNTGSAVDVRSSEADLGQFKETTIRGDAAQQAYNFRTQEAADIAESNLDMAAAAQEKKGGFLTAISSLLGGASSVSSKWMDYKRQGAFSSG
jgi:hypothetical protein